MGPLLPEFRWRSVLHGVSPRWFVVIGVALLLFGSAGSRFSFGVFLKPLTDDFGWSRESIAGALAVAGLVTGMLRPLAGWLSDRYDAKRVALLGMAVAGLALLGLSQIHQLWELYVLFLIMGAGFTLASPATVTKLVSAAFTRQRSLALSLASSGSAVGETMLVPVSAVALSVAGWRSSYVLLAIIVIVVVIPVAFALLRVRAQAEEDSGEEDASASSRRGGRSRCAWAPDQGLPLQEAARTPIFWALTAGFFT